MESSTILVMLVLGFILSVFVNLLKFNRILNWISIVVLTGGVIWTSTLIATGEKTGMSIILLTIIYASIAIKIGWDLRSDKQQHIRQQ